MSAKQPCQQCKKLHDETGLSFLRCDRCIKRDEAKVSADVAKFAEQIGKVLRGNRGK